MQTIDEALNKLEKSKFRSSFYLTKKDIAYIDEKGFDIIENHARDFVKMKLADAYPNNDGKQTPTHGHPVFKAQHATACCCRGCLNKWYHVPIGQSLTEVQQEKIVKLLMGWIQRNYQKNK